MEFGDGEETKLLVLVDGLVSSSSTCQCRICHEEEEEDSTIMESPCTCSGTLKFAHRGCIQRWCDEKGSSICEICLQKFEGGYIVPPKKAQLVDVALTIRGSQDLHRQNHESQNPSIMAIAVAANGRAGYTECTPSSERTASCCRSVALTFTIILLVRHFIAAIMIGADHNAFTVVSIFVFRAIGILLPFYLVMRMIEVIRRGQWQQQQQQQQQQLHGRDDVSLRGVEEEDDLQQHTIQIN